MRNYTEWQIINRNREVKRLKREKRSLRGKGYWGILYNGRW